MGNAERDWAELVVQFCLATAAVNSPRTVYSSRIDGLLFPLCEPVRVHQRQTGALRQERL